MEPGQLAMSDREQFMKKLRLISAIATLLALAACASPGPTATEAAAVPPHWYAPLPHNGTWADLHAWWGQFNDPLLIELITAAQEASPTVASARSRIEQARAVGVAAGAALLPTLDGTAAAARGNTQPPVPLTTTVQAGLQTAWEIDLFGTNQATARAAQSRWQGAQAGWHDARVSVAAETANSYVNLRTCERQLANLDDDARSRAETARLVGLSARAGFTAPADAALARASAAEGSVRVTQQRSQCELHVKALVALTALPEPALKLRLASGDKATAPAPMAVPAVPADLLAQRPDVYQAEREVAAASAEVDSAQAQRFPRLTLSGSIAAGAVRTGGVSADLQTWSIGPLALSVPIFDGGRRAANVDAAQARYGEAAALYAARVRQAVREVEEALVTLESARLRTEDAQTAQEGYQASFIGIEGRYRSGLASLVELEEARRLALAAQTALLALERERFLAWIALYRALGGGWVQPEPALAAASS